MPVRTYLESTARFHLAGTNLTTYFAVLSPACAMDLEDFENIDGVDTVSPQAAFNTAEEALKYLDVTWYTKTNRRGRWMDLLGDFAGSERFIVDGKL